MIVLISMYIVRTYPLGPKDISIHNHQIARNQKSTFNWLNGFVYNTVTSLVYEHWTTYVHHVSRNKTCYWLNNQAVIRSECAEGGTQPLFAFCGCATTGRSSYISRFDQFNRENSNCTVNV
jgi:hypothetical protein